jgi:hypothetical protein
MFRNGIREAVHLSSIYGEGILKRYLSEILSGLKGGFRYYWVLHVILFIGFFVGRIFRQRGRDIQWLPKALIIAVWMGAAWRSYDLGLQWGGVTPPGKLMRFYIGWLLLLITSASLSLWYSRNEIKRRDIGWRNLFLSGVLLGALPFAGAIGTGRPIFYNTLFHMTSWFGLFLLFLVVLSMLHQESWILHIGTFIIAVFACSQIISSGIFNPYRLHTGILEQVVPTEIGIPETTLKLDVTTSEFFVKIRALALKHRVKPGDDVLAFFNMPGVVFAIGGKSPGIPWYNSGYEGSREQNEMSLSLVPSERLKKAFILQTPGYSKSMPDLTKFGIHFPRDYVLCGEVVWPSTLEPVRLWRPRILDEVPKP